MIPGFRDWIRRQPCILADRDPCECGKYVNVGTKRTPIAACHIRTRRNNGDMGNLYPGCAKHHQEQHQMGVKSFEQKYGLNLKVMGREFWERFQEETRFPAARD